MEGRVLIIEDNKANSKVLQQHFEEAGFTVEVAKTGEKGCNIAVRFLPQAIVLSMSLPDMSGADVAQCLRSFARTEHVYLMMLADEDVYHERLSVLELGANDFVASPFDPVEVTLRVRNALRRANTANRTDPTTGLPAGLLLQEQLRRILNRDPDDAWGLIRFRLMNLGPFREVHGFMAVDELLRTVARLLAEALSRDDIAKDFLGYGGNNDFVVITTSERAPALVDEASEAFQNAIKAHYSKEERKQGHIMVDGEPAPLLELRAKCITPEDGPFYDIRSLTEALAG